MPTRRKTINNGNIGGTGDFKVQLASDNSGQYVEVMALDASAIEIGKVDQGTGGTSAWKVTADALPLPANAAQETGGNLATMVTDLGAVTETAPATDIASSGLNGRLQRIAQRLSSLIALLPTALGTGGGLKVDGSGTALPVSGTVTSNAGTNLNTSALALETGGNLATMVTDLGGVTETAPVSDTASSGLNGRLQRVAQRLSSVIALLPTALGTGGGLKVDGSGTALPVSGAVTVSGTVTVGQTGADGSTTITSGGSAQNLFSGATPTNGFEIGNPDPTNDLWVSDSTTAAANGTGSYRVASNGGTYTTPGAYKPIGAVSIIGSTTGQKITARKW